MKRKTIALLLALIMCLALLSACGGDSTTDTKEPPASENTFSPTGQEPADGKEEPPTQEPEQEEPSQDEPEESEEPAQEEPMQEEHAGTKLLALLQEEWKNGFVVGEGAKHTYLGSTSIHDGMVYITGLIEETGNNISNGNAKVFSYDIASKEVREAVSVSLAKKWQPGIPYITYYYPYCFLDGNFYFFNAKSGDETSGETIAEKAELYDCNGTFLNSFEGVFGRVALFEHGILGFNQGSAVLLSYDLEKIADIPAPQHEVEHGLKEEVELSGYYMFAADGTLYLFKHREDSFRLNTDTYEWEAVEMAEVSWRAAANVFNSFCGKYIVYDKCVYDWVTGEEIFNWEETGVYPPLSATQYHGQFLCYFGGDQYLGYKDGEYRWVNLTNLTMSDPLPFPSVSKSYSHQMTILDDTYCVYYDKYGWFLWNYNTGEEETIIQFDQ